MTFDFLWSVMGSYPAETANESLLQTNYRTSIYAAATNVTTSALNPRTKEPFIEINENMTLFPHFNQDGGGKDGVLASPGFTVSNIGDKLATLGLSTTANPIKGFPNLVFNTKENKYNIPMQGLAWMMSYNMAKSNSLSPGNYDPMAHHYVDDILEPMLDYLLNSQPGVDGWYSGTNGGSLSLTSNWTGTFDFDLETWLPRMLLPADITAMFGPNFDKRAPLSWAQFSGYDNVPDGGIWNHEHYFIIWAMKENFPNAAKRLPESHYANCPNPAPVKTLQQCFDIYWNLFRQIWDKISSKLKTKCPGAKLMAYNFPVDQQYWESGYADYLVSKGNITQAVADSLKQQWIDMYKRMYSDKAVTSGFSVFDAYGASWYMSGRTANPGAAEVGTPPGNTATWTYILRQKHMEARASLMNWFNTDGPGKGKPSRAYLQDLSDYVMTPALQKDEAYVDKNTCDILYNTIISAKFTGIINWGWVGAGTMNAHNMGQQNYKELFTKLNAYYNLPTVQADCSISKRNNALIVTPLFSWVHNPIARYEIYKKKSTEATYKLLGTFSTGSYTDSSVTDNTTYNYYLVAVDGYGNKSAMGIVRSFTIPKKKISDIIRDFFANLF